MVEKMQNRSSSMRGTVILGLVIALTGCSTQQKGAQEFLYRCDNGFDLSVSFYSCAGEAVVKFGGTENTLVRKTEYTSRYTDGRTTLTIPTVRKAMVEQNGIVILSGCELKERP